MDEDEDISLDNLLTSDIGISTPKAPTPSLGPSKPQGSTQGPVATRDTGGGKAPPTQYGTTKSTPSPSYVDALNIADQNTTQNPNTPSDLWLGDKVWSNNQKATHGQMQAYGKASTAEERLYQTGMSILEDTMRDAADVNSMQKGSNYRGTINLLIGNGFLLPHLAGSPNSVQNSLTDALDMYRKIPDPDMSFKEWLAARKGNNPDAGGSGGGGGGPRAFRNVTVQLTNEFDAEAIVNGAFSTFLGREANEKEVAQFWKRLNEQQKKNPNIAQGVASQSGTTQTTSGGYNAQLAADKFAERQDDYAESQVRVLKNAMQQAIKSRLGAEDGDMLNG